MRRYIIFTSAFLLLSIWTTAGFLVGRYIGSGHSLKVYDYKTDKWTSLAPMTDTELYCFNGETEVACGVVGVEKGKLGLFPSDLLEQIEEEQNPVEKPQSTPGGDHVVQRSLQVSNSRDKEAALSQR